jgi:DNA modification methylase
MTAISQQYFHLDQRIEILPITSVSVAKRNARTHSKGQIRKIADSIERFGFVNPILVDKETRAVAGHGRFEAAKLLGMRTIPALRIEHLSVSELRAYALADNQLAALAGWDQETLKIELGEISAEIPDLDLTLTGFETAEIDRILLDDHSGPVSDEADEVPQIPVTPVTRRGDMWLLGQHRVLCGDARDAASYAALLGDRRAGLVITDPPYNVPIDGHARGLGKQHHSDFAMAVGELTEKEFISFLDAVSGQMVQASRPGALHYIFMDWRHLFEALQSGRAQYEALVNLCVWSKGTGGMGSFYRSEHELVLIWRTKGDSHVNNVQLGRFGRNRTNVWRYAGANSFGPEREEMLSLHPTVKPAAMIADAILDASKRHEIVLDPFLGSGTTIIAAHRTDRVAAGIEYEPRYVDVAIQRFKKISGIEAQHSVSGRTFSEEAAHREQETASPI